MFSLFLTFHTTISSTLRFSLRYLEVKFSPLPLTTAFRYGNMDAPSREIVHSHGISNMYPHRAEWDPKDSFESLAVIGRFVGAPNVPQPIDYIDVGAGKLVAEIINPNITSVSPINKLHPRDDVLATSSARSVTIWRPEKKIFVCDIDENPSRKRKVRGESDDSDDDKSNPNSPK